MSALMAARMAALLGALAYADETIVVDVADLDVMETDSASFDGLSGHSLGA